MINSQLLCLLALQADVTIFITHIIKLFFCVRTFGGSLKRPASYSPVSGIVRIIVVPLLVLFAVILLIFLVIALVFGINPFLVFSIFFFRPYGLAILAIRIMTINISVAFTKLRKMPCLIARPALFVITSSKFQFFVVGVRAITFKAIRTVIITVNAKIDGVENSLAFFAKPHSPAFGIVPFLVGALAGFTHGSATIAGGFPFAKLVNWLFGLAFSADFEDTIHYQISCLDLVVSRLLAQRVTFCFSSPQLYHNQQVYLNA